MDEILSKPILAETPVDLSDEDQQSKWLYENNKMLKKILAYIKDEN